jgi:hypothetical protein
MELNVISFYLLYHPKRKGHFGVEMTVGLPAVRALILLFKRIMNRFPEGKIKKRDFLISLRSPKFSIIFLAIDFNQSETQKINKTSSDGKFSIPEDIKGSLKFIFVLTERVNIMKRRKEMSKQFMI